MNWKPVFGLSLFGLAMGVATVFWIPSNVEPVFWLAIFLICAFLVARKLPRQHFTHGLAIGIVNSIWVTTAHVLFFSEYIAGHPRESAMTKSMPMPDSPRFMMALVGPIIGILSGVVLDLFCLAASKMVKPRLNIT